MLPNCDLFERYQKMPRSKTLTTQLRGISFIQRTQISDMHSRIEAFGRNAKYFMRSLLMLFGGNAACMKDSLSPSRVVSNGIPREGKQSHCSSKRMMTASC